MSDASSKSTTPPSAHEGNTVPGSWRYIARSARDHFFAAGRTESMCGMWTLSSANPRGVKLCLRCEQRLSLAHLRPSGGAQ